MHRLWTRGITKLTAKTPRIFVQKELKARDMVFNSFKQYWLSDWSDAADVIKARKRLYDREGVSLEDQAGNQASFNLALLGNTVPTAFWAFYDIISRPQLLESIRAEVEAKAVERISGEDQTTFELDVAALRTKCPLLLSSYQETQRTKSIHANIREVISDTSIESPTTETCYFLARGQYVQMPSGPIHKDPNIWGPSASAFDPYRFVKDSSPLPKSELPNSYAFLAWGSAPHLCPARQFASTEIMLFIALMVLRFEFEQNGGGEWKVLKPKNGELVTVMPPKDEVVVDIRRRVGWQGKWVLNMGESSKRVALASG
jgi:cytochrome P450